MAMSLIIMIGGIMIIIGATLTFIVVSFLDSTYGYRDTSQALAVAQSGVQDAMIQFERNNNFATNTVVNYCVPDPNCGSGAALVSVTPNSPVSGQATIISSASVNGRQRNIKEVVRVSTTTSQVELVSWQILQ